MKWHRNPFFHTAVLPPSVAPSTMASARPSADIDAATAAAFRAAAARTSARPSTDAQRQSLQIQPPQIVTESPEDAEIAEAKADSPPYATSPRSPSAQRVSFQEPRASLQLSAGARSPAPSHLNLHQQQQRASLQLPRRQGSQHSTATTVASNTQNPQNTPDGILAEAAKRVVQGGPGRRRRSKKVPKLTICEPSDHLTPYQTFYIFGIDGLGAFVLSGGINFAIGYAMYKTINTDNSPIRLFQFPNTLCGDAALTIFIQVVMTWFIELVLVNRDLRSGHIQPIGFIREPSSAAVRWFLLLDRRPVKTEANTPTGGDARVQERDADSGDTLVEYEPGSWKHWAAFLVSQLVRALVIGVLMFMVMWPPTIGILTALGDKRGGDWWYDGSSWAPPLFKLVYGGVLAALTTPPFAAFWLVRCGWALQANERHLEAAAAAPSV